MKRFLTLLAFVALAITANAVIQSGTCGANVTFVLNDDGTLAISGSGSMSNFYSDSSPWISNRDKIIKVQIKDGVTSIGNYAFYKCTGLTSIEIPNSVTSIGSSAFSLCSSLTSIAIPNSVASIGWDAFYNCTSLNSVNIPNSVLSISPEAFYHCAALTSITIPNSVTSIGQYAFRYCYNLASVSIPNSVTSIGEAAFGNCEKLTSVYCYATEIPSTRYEDFEQFENCPLYRATLYVPASSLDAYKTKYPWSRFMYIQPLPALVSSISINASSSTIIVGETETLTATVLPENAKDKTVTWSSSNPNVISVNANTGEITATGLGKSTITATAVDGSGVSGSCEITAVGNKVSSISVSSNKSFAYRGEKVTFTANVLPEDAAKAVKWSSSDSNILCIDEETGVAQALKNGSVTITASATDGSGVTGRKVFNCYIDSDFDVCIDDLYYNINETTQEATVTYFSDNRWDEDGDYYPINYNSPLKGAVVIPETFVFGSVEYKVTSIGNSAFDGCSKLTSVTIPNSVTSIGTRAFSYCSGLTSVTIPNSVTSIGYWAFEHCSGLTSVTIGNSVTSIGADAFTDCTNVKELIYAEGTKTVLRTGLTSINSVTIPNSVTSIDNLAFYGCSYLLSITVQNSVVSIGAGAFSGCGRLTSLKVDSSNSKYTSEDNVLFNIDKTELICCAGGKQGTYIIPNSVTNIGNYAFSSCSGLTSVTIPNSVTSIGNLAFSSCSGLTSVTIPNSVTSIGNYAFFYCSGLTSVTIPNSVTSIGDYAFYGCSGLTSVTIPNSVTSIGNSAFSYCSNLQELTCLASEVPTLGSSVFSGTKYITSGVLYVPQGSVEAYKAASQWKSWKSIEGIKESLELIDGEAYTNAEEKTYDELTFTKTFSSSVVNKWNALYVPMSINIEDYLDDFDFAEIFNISPTEDTNGDGEIDGRDANKLIVNKLKTGTTNPNKPYLIRPKNAGTYTFASADNVLYPAEEKSYSCSTMTDEYTFTGLYASQGVMGNDKYYMTINGVLDFSPTKTITVKPNRWIMTVKSRNGSSSSANAKAISLSVIGEDEGTTAIEHVDAVRNDGNIYNLNGVKMDSKNLPAGIYIKNGKKVFVK
ncbi:MAG: leucine-rich repeat protein [Bacteroidaceae bacterium]|nr:leucine-rich repeat protein [Bacteroidaceae bacterium]